MSVDQMTKHLLMTLLLFTLKWRTFKSWAIRQTQIIAYSSPPKKMDVGTKKTAKHEKAFIYPISYIFLAADEAIDITKY